MLLSTSPMIMQTMATVASSPEEELANMTKLVEGLTEHVQHQQCKIYKWMHSIQGLLDREASYTL